MTSKGKVNIEKPQISIINKNITSIVNSIMNIDDILVDNNIQSKILGLLHISSSEFFDENRLLNNEFKSRRLRTWAYPIKALKLFNQLSLELVLLFLDENKEKKINKYKRDTSLRLHGRAIQIALEIILLLEEGLPDGAYARWRSLFEIEIIIKFLHRENDLELYQMYREHGVYRDYENERKARENGFQYMTNEVFKEYEKSFNQFKDKYELKLFIKDYGWAYKKIENCSFNRLIKSLGYFNKLDYYDRSSSLVHGDALGTFSPISMMDGYQNIIGCGQTDYGLSIPGQNTLISILNIMSVMNDMFNTKTGTVILMSLNQNMDDYLQSFMQIQKEMEVNLGMPNR